MEWYNKFKVGQRVRIVKKVGGWSLGSGETNWVSPMDKTIGNTYTIISIDEGVGYKLKIGIPRWPGDDGDYWYPVDSLGTLVGTQLEFSFMEG